jgi:UDP-2,3-diacylglucosamine hydrolase
MTTLFASDVHIYPSHQGNREAFVDFLHHQVRGAEALYILGDLFHCWIGDEACEMSYYLPVIDGFRSLTRAGISINLIVGNRDFLLGERFEHESGCKLLSDPSVIDLYGRKVVIMHGDTLCTEDHGYQKFRQTVRGESWRQQFLSKSITERERLCDEYSEMSDASKSNKSLEIMDATPEAIEKIMRQHEVRDMIHGHTHRPGEHIFDLDGKKARRVVLGDWYNGSSFLACSESGWHLDSGKRKQTRQNTAGN